MENTNVILDEKDLHCLLWMIRSDIHTGNILHGCRYCRYSKECEGKRMAGDYFGLHYYDLIEKLEKAISPPIDFHQLREDGRAMRENYH